MTLDQSPTPRLATRVPRTALAAITVALMTTACGGSINVWPFGGEKVAERTRTPANATEYQCNAGKRFFVRQLDGGNAVWLIFAEREVRLDKSGGDNRFSNSVATLELNGNEAALTDGTVAYAGCKVPAPK